MTSETKKFHLGKVMVIGGCGFLGHHMVNLLLRDYSVSVSVIDLKCVKNRRPDSDGVKYFEGDITDANRMISILEEVKPDVVIHTASPAVQATGKVLDELFRKVNVDGTQSIIEACQKTRVKALVYTSSASIISDNSTDLVNADERWPVIRGKAQTEYYSETKAAAEELVLKANEPSKLLTCAIRPAGIMGEGDTMAIYHIVNAFRERKHNVQIGENNNLFDFTYVENVVHAHLLAARALLMTYESTTAPLDHERVDGEAFLVTNGEPVYFWDFARTIWKYSGSKDGIDKVWHLSRDIGLFLGYMSEVFSRIMRKPPTITRKRIEYSTMTRYYDISKARRRLGYEPMVSLEEGIRRGVEWSLDQERKGLLGPQKKAA